MAKNLTYRDAGVNIDAGAELVRRIAPITRTTARPEMLSGLGGFAAMTELPAGYEQPVLVTGTDGVGTKLKLAIDHNQHDTVGQDLVAMCANDVLVCGAEPLLFLDYYATSALDVDVAERVITGIAKGCTLAGCALAGGETAEMPGFYGAGDYDLAGFCVGVVEKRKIISGADISAGDQLLGLASSGPHSNGYSLIRRIIANQGLAAGDPLIQALLQPTRIYVKAVRAALTQARIHGMVHITGGGFFENVPRMLPDPTLAALLNLDAWQRPDVFSWLQQAGNVTDEEMLRTFNCGIGFVLAVPQEDVEQATKALQAGGETVIHIGQIVAAGTTPQNGELLIAGA